MPPDAIEHHVREITRALQSPWIVPLFFAALLLPLLIAIVEDRVIHSGERFAEEEDEEGPDQC